MAETNRDLVLQGKVVRVSDKRLLEMQSIAIKLEGVFPGEYHWHFAAALNELIAARRIIAAAARLRGISLTPTDAEAARSTRSGPYTGDYDDLPGDRERNPPDA